MTSHKLKGSGSAPGPKQRIGRQGASGTHPKKPRGTRKERSGTSALVIAGGIVLLVIVLALLAR